MTQHTAARGTRLRLTGDAAGVSQARRFVRQVLEDAHRSEWVDGATLAASELVTNSVLHAHSEIELAVTLHPDHVRIEVADQSPALPASRAYGATATTGRGLDLVAAVSFEYGVEPRGSRGKVVWCCINGTESGQDPTFLDHEWADLVESARPAPQAADAVRVKLLGLSPTLWLAAGEHHEALLRELALLEASGTPDQPAALAPDLAVADRARRRILDAVTEVVDAARQRGEATSPLPERHPGELPAVPTSVDLEIVVPRGEGDGFSTLQDVLDLGERLALHGDLLEKPGLPEVVALRDWACEQVIAQLGGTAPSPWVGAHDERFAAAPPRADVGAHDAVTASDRGLVAVDDSNRIVAVSDSLARVLGWQREELVGRRVVAIIPPRYREAHVAGFTRHLSTGVARALDVPLRLPVLRADGGEVECHFLIHAERSPSGRNLYVAAIEPVEGAPA